MAQGFHQIDGHVDSVGQGQRHRKRRGSKEKIKVKTKDVIRGLSVDLDHQTAGSLAGEIDACGEDSSAA